MNQPDEYYDEIHRYLLGEMAADEATAFEARLAADAPLAEALRLEEELQMLIYCQRRAALKQMLRDTPTDGEDESDDETQAKPDGPIAPPSGPSSSGGMRHPFRKYALYASGLAAILIAAIMIFKGNPEFDSDAAVQRWLAIGNYQPLVERGDASETHPGYVAYSKQDWAMAFALLDTTGTSAKPLLMHGVSAMHTENWDHARRDFSRLAGHSERIYSDHAIWFLALLDLHYRDYAACRQRLTFLIDTKGYKMEEAQDLRSALPQDR